jgi:hypothetical protein
METLKRRRFLKGTLSTAGILLAKPLLAAESVLQEPKDNSIESTNSNRISIMCYSFHGLLAEEKMNIFGFLESCKYRYNVKGVELWNDFIKSTEESYIKKVRDALDERDLICSSLAVDNAECWPSDTSLQESRHKVALENLKAGVILGSRFVRIDAGGGFQDKEWTNEAFDFIVKRYKEYCQFAHDNGFKIGPEVHWGPETYFPNMKRLVEAVNHPAFGIIQMMNSFKGTPEEKSAADKEAAKWACATHFSWDVCENAAMLEERMTFLKNEGYQGLFGIEHHSGKNEYANTGIQVAKVRAMLEKWRQKIV